MIKINLIQKNCALITHMDLGPFFLIWHSVIYNLRLAFLYWIKDW